MDLRAAPTPARGSFLVDPPPVSAVEEEEGTVVTNDGPSPGPCADPGPSPCPDAGGGMLPPPSLVAGRLPSRLSLNRGGGGVKVGWKRSEGEVQGEEKQRMAGKGTTDTDEAPGGMTVAGRGVTRREERQGQKQGALYRARRRR